MLRKCDMCYEEKETTDFAKNNHRNDKLQSYCKECGKAKSKYHYRKGKKRHIEKVRQRHKEIVEWYKEYKSTLKCSVCGFNHVAALDFHHKDPSQKKIAVSCLSRYGKKSILRE